MGADPPEPGTVSLLELARTLLLKIERRGLIELPARQRPSTNHLRNRDLPEDIPAGESVRGSLRGLRPLTATLVAPRSNDMRLFNGLLASHHYLGHRNTVGDLPAALRRRQGTCTI